MTTKTHSKNAGGYIEGLVSVLIPGYNGQEYIGAAIESILAQTYRPIEIIVVDDGSPVSMEDSVAGFGPEVRYFRKENGGTASARNYGMRYAQGEFIALLDQDDLWLPHKLERQIPRFAEDPKIGLVVAWQDTFDTVTGEVKGVYEPPEELDVYDILGYMLPPVQSMVFRRTALDQIGGFDAGLLGTDDWDVNIRMAAEFRVVGVPEILGRARMHPNQQGGNGKVMYRECMKMLDKHQHLYPDREKSRKAVQKSRKLVSGFYYDYNRGLVRKAVSEGRYADALLKAAWAYWKYPPGLAGLLGRALFRR